MVSILPSQINFSKLEINVTIDFAMKKKFLITGFIFIVFILTVAIGFYFFRIQKNLPKATAPESQAKVFKIGSRWLYQTRDATVSVEVTSLKKIGKNKVFVYEYRLVNRKSKPQGAYYIQNNKGLWLAGVYANTTSVTYNPPVVIFKNPLKIGGHWQTTYERSDLPGVKFVYKSKITRFFKGKTPAGNFDCYLIEQSTYPQSQPDRVFRKNDWYSPEVGLVYHASQGEMSSTQSSLLKYQLKTE